MKTFAVILLAGSSTRFGSNQKKQFFQIKGKPLFQYSLDAFENSKEIDEIVLVSSKEDKDKVESLVKNNYKKVSSIVVGGNVRQESVKHGLDAIKDKDGYVLIHDSARPLVDEEIVSSLIKALKNAEGAAPAIKVVDTLIRVNNNELESYEDRNSLLRIQTPQAFHLSVIKDAHKKYAGKNYTDDTQLVKLLHKKVAIIEGKEQLLKVTSLEDTHAVEAYIEQHEYLQN